MQCVAVRCSMSQLHPLPELSPVFRSISPTGSERSRCATSISLPLSDTRGVWHLGHTLSTSIPFSASYSIFLPLVRVRSLPPSYSPLPRTLFFFPSLPRSHARTRVRSFSAFSPLHALSLARALLSLMLCALAVTLPLLFFCLSLTPSFSHSCYPLMRARTLLLFDLAAARLLTHSCAVFFAHYHTHFFLTLTRIYTYFASALFSLCLADFSCRPFSCCGRVLPTARLFANMCRMRV